VHVSYELRALAGRYELVARAASEAGTAAVELPQGYGLMPITSGVSGRLGGGGVKPFGDVFWFLSGAIGAAWRRRPTSPRRTSSRFVRRLERAADLGQNSLAHGQDGPKGQPLSRIVSPTLLGPGHRMAERLARDPNRIGEPLPVG
jgi:hypothetical protein